MIAIVCVSMLSGATRMDNGISIAMLFNIPSRPPKALRRLSSMSSQRTDSTFGPHKRDRKSTRLNASLMRISYAAFCSQKKLNQLVLKEEPRMLAELSKLMAQACNVISHTHQR